MIARASLPHDAATLRFLLLFSLYHLSPKQRDGVGDSKSLSNNDFGSMSGRTMQAEYYYCMICMHTHALNSTSNNAQPENNLIIF